MKEKVYFGLGDKVCGAFSCKAWVLVCACAAIVVLSCLYSGNAEAETVIVPTRASDPPHNITHFLHSVQTNDSAKYFTPSFSVINYMDTTLDFGENWTNVTGSEQFALQWYMYPALASNLTVTRMDTIMWISGIVATGTPNFAGSIAIYEVTPQNMTDLNFDGYQVFYNNIPSSTVLYASPTTPLAFNITGTHTFLEGSTIRLVVTINPGTSGGGGNLQKTNVTVWWDGRSNFDSRLIMHTTNPMTINDVWTENCNGTAQSCFIDEGNTTMFFNAEISDPFGGYDIKWVNLTIFDMLGVPIAGEDDIPMDRYYGNNFSAISRYEHEFNYSGLQFGLYGFEVWAVDNSGYTFFHYFARLTYERYDERMAANWSIGKMYNLTIHLNDSIGNSLAGAGIDFDGIAATTNATGFARMMVFGNGTLSVTWRGCVVYENFTTIVNDSELWINCSVYHPEIVFVDDLGIPLQGAAVFFSYPDGSELPVALTDDLGSIGIVGYAPEGNSTVSAWWRGAIVYDGFVDIQSNNQIVVKCNVFYLNITALDPWGDPLSLANVVAVEYETHILLESRTVNDDGTAFLRLPQGMYDTEVIWHGCSVGAVENVSLHSNADITIIGNVVLVNFMTVDERDAPLPAAHVVVSSSTEVCISSITDLDGGMRAVLPSGTFDILVYWYGIEVHSSQMALNESTNVTLDCSVVYVTLTAIDSRDAPVQAYITLESTATGGVCAAGSTDELGNITLKLAVGSYEMTAYMLDVLVNDSTISVSPGNNILVECAVYYIDCSALDARQSAATNISLSFVRTSGSFTTSAFIDASGQATARMPAGTYDIVATYLGIVVNSTSVEVSSDSSIAIECAIYYLDVSAHDLDGLPLEGADMFVASYDLSFRTVTDSDGNATVIAPVGTYSMKLFWLGTLVNETAIDLSSNLALEPSCSVREVRFTMLDGLGLPLSEAQFELSTGGKLAYSLKSNASGQVAARLPEANASILVSWKGIEVARETIFANSSEYTIDCSVVYARFVPVDDRNIVIKDAQVKAVSSIGPLGAEECGDAYAEIKLPAGEWQIVVNWLGVEIANVTLVVNDSVDYRLDCAVIYAQMRPLDAKSTVVRGAFVSIYSANGMLAAGECVSDALEFRLPEGRWLTTVVWKGVEVSNLTVEYTQSKAYDLTCSVVYAKISPVDSRNAVLQRAQLTIFTNDSLLAAEEAGADGATIKLPVGEWRIVVTWMGAKVADVRKAIGAGDISVACSVSYLTVKAKDKDGASLDGVGIAAYSSDGQLLGYANTKGGRAELRLPDGAVVVNGKVSKEYLMSHFEQGVKKDATLAGDVEVVLSFDYPPAIYTTNAFIISIIVAVFACALAGMMYALTRGKAQKSSGNGEGDRSDKPKDEEKGGDESAEK